jgi:hypothetical protein
MPQKHPCVGEPDGSLADWLVRDLFDWDRAPELTVAMLVPPRFDAVARVSHLDPEEEGEPGIRIMRALVDVLRPATTAPDDVRFLIWYGWGGTPWHDWTDAAQVEAPLRPCRLLRGPIEGVLVSLDPWLETLRPLWWWPADEAWLVCTEIDFAWTFVAGSDALVTAVCERADIDVGRTSFDAIANG